MELTLCVQPRIVPSLLARIDMDPPSLLLRVYLGPYMVFLIPYPPHSASDSTAEHAEAVGPLPAAPSS